MKKNEKYNLGDRINIYACGEYIIATPDGKSLCLIHLSSGNRFADAKELTDTNSLPNPITRGHIIELIGITDFTPA